MTCRLTVREGDLRSVVSQSVPFDLQYDAMTDYKHCQIVRGESGDYVLNGAKRSFDTLGELLNCYQKEALRTDGYTFQLTKCCPPSPKRQSHE